MHPMILLFLMMTIVLFLLYKIIVKPFPEEEIKRTDQKELIFNIDQEFYKSQILKSVHYSIVNEYSYDIDEFHSIDNAVFMEFENDKWLSIMFNGELEIFTIEDLNPFNSELDHIIQDVSQHFLWKPIIGRELVDMNIVLDENNGFWKLDYLNLSLGTNDLLIACTNEITQKENVFPLSSEWLVLIFDKSIIKNKDRFKE